MLRRGETQALLIITHSGTVKSHLLQAQRAPDILCICTISISCGQSESYSHRLTIYTLSRQRLCGKKSCKGFTDLLVLVGIFREKNREPDLKLQLQITVGVCVSVIVYQCVAYGSPQPAPSALTYPYVAILIPLTYFTYTLQMSPQLRSVTCLHVTLRLQLKQNLGN